ncbi:pilus assembly protein TadG-related protein [Aquincola sp. MAHUQ-54]|uniref:Pilus assembly protein TadG-related protein n=1 Tax=Aquincola agrisoli TaxID=3119538 RepID=A0AAW9QJG6_9BURK
MSFASPSRGWPGIRSRQRQKGQALVYGIFVLVGGLAALFFLFNTGQLSREKTKLVNTADAVAYSAGVMHARALNFDAYTNRALVANEVLVAQMVSISSWAQYMGTHAQNFLTLFPGCASVYTSWVEALRVGEYAAMCVGLFYAYEYVADVMELVPDVTHGIVAIVEGNKRIILGAQSVLHGTLPFMRARVMDEVARANYAAVERGDVSVEPRIVAAPMLTNEWNGFTRQYADDDRDRFAEVARLAAYSDDFVKARTWTSRGLVPESGGACLARWRVSEVRRRGGTELIGFDEWKAEDTASYHSWRSKGLSCRARSDVPIGWGEQQAHPAGADQDESSARLGGSPSTNPRAHGRASSAAWEVYSGLPPFYELSPAALAEEDPRLRFAVRVTRDRTETVASEGRSAMPVTDRLNNYRSDMPRDLMAAVATSEAYFERPVAHRDNVHGAARGTPRELGSLFNPYWQVHLVESPTDVLRARLQQAGF